MRPVQVNSLLLGGQEGSCWEVFALVKDDVDYSTVCWVFA